MQLKHMFLWVGKKKMTLFMLKIIGTYDVAA